MGGRHSKHPPPPDYPPIDNIFIPVGCSGFTRAEYSIDKVTRLSKAPFLMYNFIVPNFKELQDKIVFILDTLPIELITPRKDSSSGTSTPSTEPSIPVYNISGYDDEAKVYGPVYLLIALDVDTNSMECYMYFPSLQKNGKPWGSYYMLAFYHRWLYTILYSSSFSIKPFTSCFMRKGLPDYSSFGGRGIYKNSLVLETQRPVSAAGGIYNDISTKPITLDTERLNTYILNENYNDIGSLPLGCVSKKDKCVQSDSVHRAMNIYDDRKNNERMIRDSDDKDVANSKYGYPMVYFRSYILNFDDPRITNYFNRNSFTSLQINGLVQDFDMIAGCGNMLVSTNFDYFLILESRQFVIYKNRIGRDVLTQCIAKKLPTTYGTVSNVVKFGGGIDTRMVIEESKLNVYSKISKDDDEMLVFSTTICISTAVLPITLVLDKTGKLIVYDALSKDVTASDLNELNNKAKSLEELYSSGLYDPVLDRRRRMVNLVAYMKLRNAYVEPIKNDNGEMVDGVLDETQFPKYDEKQDYISRYNMLIDEYIVRGALNPGDPYAQHLGISVDSITNEVTVANPLPSITSPESSITVVGADGTTQTVTNTPEDPYAVEKARIDAINKKNKEDAEKRQKAEDAQVDNEFKMIVSDPTAIPIVPKSLRQTADTTNAITSNEAVYEKTNNAAILDNQELQYAHSKMYDTSLDLSVRVKYLLKYFEDNRVRTTI